MWLKAQRVVQCGWSWWRVWSDCETPRMDLWAFKPERLLHEAKNCLYPIYVRVSFGEDLELWLGEDRSWCRWCKLEISIKSQVLGRHAVCLSTTAIAQKTFAPSLLHSTWAGSVSFAMWVNFVKGLLYPMMDKVSFYARATLHGAKTAILSMFELASARISDRDWTRQALVYRGGWKLAILITRS
jgi:hypothetical protein